MTVIVADANPGGAADTLQRASKTITFDGTAGNGAVGTVAVFTVTGRVFVEYVVAFCTTDLTEALATATMVLGTATDTDALLGDATGGPTAIDANEFWIGAAAPVAGGLTSATNATGGQTSTARNKAISENIILTIGAQAVNGGVLVITAFWHPITDGATLT